ncbi:MAG: single-stranded-DNA-specific exonuclease RecJ [Candidatus Buchananbacteria bacterium]
MSKIWQLLPRVNQEFIDQFPEINNITLQLLHNRGLKTSKEIEDFLFPNYDQQIFDPYLFKDMEKAVDRLIVALHKKQKILVYGDYDADGVCSTSILYATLNSLGLEVDTYIPFRESEGYGLNKKIVQTFIKQKYDLIITVDCGVSNISEIELLNENGIDVIILDHHQEPMKRPNAVAIINPSLNDSGYPFPNLCGAGVVFKFVQALIVKLEEMHSPIKLPPGFEKWLLDLVAIATIGDIVPLISENRIFVKYGLMVLEKSRNIGLKKLIESINNKSGKIDTTYVGWRIVPRINAAGRIDHASLALNLVMAKTEDEAAKLTEVLENNNKKRQQLTENILNQAMSQVGEPVESVKLLWVVGEKWPTGVVGLVAGRISDKFNRPILVISKDEIEGVIKYVGSGRSVTEFNITAALKKCEKFLFRFGGHSQACGFTCQGDDNFEEFRKLMTSLAEKDLSGVDLISKIDIDAELKISEVNWELWEDLDKFEPFGEGNLKPLFLATNLNIEQVQGVGVDGKHLRLMVSQDGNQQKSHKLIGFSFGDWCAKLQIGDKIDIVFELDINEWNGNRELQLKLVDLKLSDNK